jgi:two-component system response regulator YesN
MYRLLIADDERHIVEWLMELFKAQTDMELEIYSCFSGIDVLKILENMRIDIILLDIKMPGLNGLEVAEKVMNNWPSCRIIFLTGFVSFDCVYQVNKQKNITYLLKTEDDDEIIKAVKTAIDSINRDMKSVEIINEVQAKEEILRHLIERNLLEGIVKGRPYEEVKNLMLWYDQKFNFSLAEPVFLLYAKLKTQRSSRFITDDSKHIIKLRHLTKKLLNKMFKFSILDLNNTTLLWFIQPAGSLSDFSIHPLQYLKESLDGFVISCKKYFHLDTLFLLYSKPVSWDMVPNVYELLNQYSMDSSSLGEKYQSFGMIFGEKEENSLLCQNRKLFQKSDVKKILNELNSYLYQGEKKRFFTIFNELSCLSHKVNSMHYLPMIEIYQTVSLIFTGYINQFHLLEKVSAKIRIYPLYYINEFTDWKEAFLYLEQLAHIIFELVSIEQMDNTQRLMVTITHYINNHLSEPLTLTRISDYVNYNSSYISRLFKQNMNMNFSEFINEKRMEKAKELLKTTNKKVDVISKEVGFDNSKYFFRVFREATGMSPREYRIQNNKASRVLQS